MNDNNSGRFVTGLLVGGIIGALVGLLLAPKSGAETRAELVKKGEAWRSQADVMAADLRSRGMAQVGEVSQRFGPAVDTLKERGSATLETVRETGSEAVATARQRVDAVRHRGNNQQTVTEDGEADKA
ncbi:MAG: YtxH domain-containing protein [Dehalococcoidia bacterium]|nr:YtxH domain-containing protein [Dehalococcoidia bacterium]